MLTGISFIQVPSVCGAVLHKRRATLKRKTVGSEEINMLYMADSSRIGTESADVSGECGYIAPPGIQTADTFAFVCCDEDIVR